MAPIIKLFGGCKSIKDYGYRLGPDGSPIHEDCLKSVFTDYYSTVESFTLFRALYYNQERLQDKFVGFWGAVADRLGDNVNVVGFDPWNEPIASWRSFADFLNNLIPGNYDRNLLGPLYERVYDRANKAGIMMFEPSLFPDYISSKMFGMQILEKVFPVGW